MPREPVGREQGGITRGFLRRRASGPEEQRQSKCPHPPSVHSSLRPAAPAGGHSSLRTRTRARAPSSTDQRPAPCPTPSRAGSCPDSHPKPKPFRVVQVVGEPRVLVRRDAHFLARWPRSGGGRPCRGRTGRSRPAARGLGYTNWAFLSGPPSYWPRKASVTFSTSFSRMTGAASTSVQTLKNSGAWSRPVLHSDPYPRFLVAIEMPARCSCRPRG